MKTVEVYPDVYVILDELYTYIDNNNIDCEFPDNLGLLDNFLEDKDKEECCRESGQAIIMREDGNIIAFLISQCSCLCYLYVDKQHRNQGVGKHLVDIYAFKYLDLSLFMEEFEHHITCYCEEELRSYYEKLGFVFQGIRERYNNSRGYSIMSRAINEDDYEILCKNIAKIQRKLQYVVTRDE